MIFNGEIGRLEESAEEIIEHLFQQTIQRKELAYLIENEEKYHYYLKEKLHRKDMKKFEKYLTIRNKAQKIMRKYYDLVNYYLEEKGELYTEIPESMKELRAFIPTIYDELSNPDKMLGYIFIVIESRITHFDIFHREAKKEKDS